jgi:hypothetical protein
MFKKKQEISCFFFLSPVLARIIHKVLQQRNQRKREITSGEAT